MTKKEREILADMVAFISFAIDRGLPFTMVLGTLGHDTGGIIRKEKCFSPRTHGYAKQLAK